MSNITSVVFGKEEEKTIYEELWQYDYGQILRIEGLNLPQAVEIHFSLQESSGEAKRRIGITKDGVTDVLIPDFILEGNKTTRDYYAYAFIYVANEESGETTHKIKMSIKSRPEPEGNTGTDDTSFGAIMEAIKKIAEGKADGLKYESSVLKLMSGDTELARVTITGGSGGSAREIELQKSDTAIQWRYVGEETWKDLISLSELKGTDGKSAYEYAKDGGYTGTEEEFSEKLATEWATKKEVSELSEQKVNLPKDENGNVLVGKKEQILMSNGDGTTQWADSVSLDGGSNDGIPFKKQAKIVQQYPIAGSALQVISIIEPNEAGVSSISLTRCGKNLVNITDNKTSTAPPNFNIDVLTFAGEYLTGQAYLQIEATSETTVGRIRVLATADGKNLGYQGNDIIAGTEGVSTTGLQIPENSTVAYFGFVRSSATTLFGYSQVQVEIGETMTEYEEYSGDTYNIALGQTVYGGKFDWSTGELTITHELVDGVVTEKAEKETVTLESKNIYALSTASGINTIYSSCGETIVSGYTGTTGGVINSETSVTLKYKEKNLLAIGDSITEQGKYLTSLQSYVPFASMDNQGIGGSTVVNRGQYSDGCVLIDSLEENVKNADVITIGYGTNDTNYIKNNDSITMGELQDYGSEFDKNTFYGAYQYLVEKILTWNPLAKLIFIVPAPAMIIDSNTMTIAEKRELSDKVAQAVRDIANYYSYEYVDLYFKSGMNEFNRLTYAPDGVHPQEAFGDISAKKFIPILLY